MHVRSSRKFMQEDEADAIINSTLSFNSYRNTITLRRYGHGLDQCPLVPQAAHCLLRTGSTPWGLLQNFSLLSNLKCHPASIIQHPNQIRMPMRRPAGNMLHHFRLGWDRCMATVPRYTPD